MEALNCFNTYLVRTYSTQWNIGSSIPNKILAKTELTEIFYHTRGSREIAFVNMCNLYSPAQ